MPTKLLVNSTNLDLLRAVAVAFVVADHSLKFFGHPYMFGFETNWLGRLGVMFFFVHTCTVLMLSLERQQGSYAGFRLWGNFYIRRAFRIYPLSIFAVCAVLTFHIPSERIAGRLTFDSFAPTKAELFGNLTLLQNIFPRHSRNIIGVLWSLPFEVQMYVLLPGLFLWLASKGRLKELLWLWVASWVVAYFVHPLQYIPHFLPGVMAYVIASKYQVGKWNPLLFPLLIAALTLGYFAVGPNYVVGRVVCLGLGLGLPFFANLRIRAVNLVTHQVAKYSYGVYLAHLFCLWVAFDKFHAHQPILFAALLIVVPVLLFHLIESPMIRIGIQVGEKLAGSTKGRRAVPEAVATVP